MSRSRSRSPAAFVAARDGDWDDDMQDMFDTFKAYEVNETDDMIGETVRILNEKGVKFKNQIEHCPPEVLSH